MNKTNTPNKRVALIDDFAAFRKLNLHRDVDQACNESPRSRVVVTGYFQQLSNPATDLSPTPFLACRVRVRKTCGAGGRMPACARPVPGIE